VPAPRVQWAVMATAEEARDRGWKALWSPTEGLWTGSQGFSLVSRGSRMRMREELTATDHEVVLFAYPHDGNPSARGEDQYQYCSRSSAVARRQVASHRTYRFTITAVSSTTQSAPITIGPPIASIVAFGCTMHPGPRVMSPRRSESCAISAVECALILVDLGGVSWWIRSRWRPVGL
jgi:hypothetical protein